MAATNNDNTSSAVSDAEQQFASQASQLYKKLAEIPAPQKGWIQINQEDKSINIASTFQQKDLIAESSRTVLNLFTKFAESKSFRKIGFPTDLVNVHLYLPSPSGKQIAIIRTKDESATVSPAESNYNIEIWNNNQLVSSIITKGKHGFIYNDETFGDACWSHDERYLIYVAEVPRKKNFSFWSVDKEPTADPSLRGGQYDYTEDWGETYTGKSTPGLFILDIQTQSVRQIALKNDNEDFGSVGQVNVDPQGYRLAFVAFKTQPRKLGVKYCINRDTRSAIYVLDNYLDNATPTRLPGSDLITRCPRFTPDGSSLLYIASNELNTHNTVVAMKKFSFGSKTTSVLVDIVTDLKQENGYFPGIFLTAGVLASKCFVTNDVVLFDSIYYSNRELLAVNINSGKVEKVNHSFDGIDATTAAQRFASWSVLDSGNGHVLAVASSPTYPQTLLYGKTSDSFGQGQSSAITWTVLQAPNAVSELDGISWKIHRLGTLPTVYEYIELLPKSADPKTPLVVCPHGGPHSSWVTEYVIGNIFLAVHGMALILVNYRGSLGFGKTLLDSLPGNCGSQDVQECIASMEHALARNIADKTKIAAVGGSHGGFLSGHLIGQDTRFKAAVMRNPVTNVAVMSGITDIPEWCWVETGASSSEDVDVMIKKSPQYHVAKVTAATLIVLGDSDRRVPNLQGIQFYNELKKRNVPTAVKMYPKTSHAILKPELEADQLMHTLLWLHKYL